MVPRISGVSKGGWAGEMTNLLTQPLFTCRPLGRLSLPGVLAALSRDEVEGIPALRPHQAMFWHMFTVQLGALALDRAGLSTPPKDEGTCRDLLRGLTPDFPDDEPWRLIVEDWTRPAFLQPAVPEGVKLGNSVATPDGVDMLITARNHDVKQNLALNHEAEDWIFALLTLQTGEGYGGRGNNGIARMNGGSASRPMLTLAPLPGRETAIQTPRPGAWFRRDLSLLSAARQEGYWDDFGYRLSGGLGLVWLAPWPEGDQLRLKQLDPLFIEICRRVRLIPKGEAIAAVKGVSAAPRIDAKGLNGALGDPWAPVHKTENKCLTLGEADFDYRKMQELLLSGDWARPLTARRTGEDQNLTVVAQALSRGNSKTDGFKQRFIPISPRVSGALFVSHPDLGGLAQDQAQVIAGFSKMLRGALALIVVGGYAEKRSKDDYAYGDGAVQRLVRFADTVFFPILWRRFELLDDGQRESADAELNAFIAELWRATQQAFEAELPSLPCPSLLRPRAEANARSYLRGVAFSTFPDALKRKPQIEDETPHAG